jgi:hypothetical protein
MRRRLLQHPAVGGVHLTGRCPAVPAGLPRFALGCSDVGCRRLLLLFAVGDPGLLVLSLLLLTHTELPIESMIVP